MTGDFARLVSETRQLDLAAARGLPLVAELSGLGEEGAVAFVTSYARYREEVGPLATTAGVGADIAAFLVVCALLSRRDLAWPADLLMDQRPALPPDEWVSAALATAARGGFSEAQMARALTVKAFAAGAAQLVPFGDEPWARGLRERAARLRGPTQAAWARFLELAHTADLPLAPGPSFFDDEIEALLTQLAPMVPDATAALASVTPPPPSCADPEARDGLRPLARGNARLLHALALLVAHADAPGSRAALANLARAAFAEVPGLGRCLPRLGYRAAFALAATGSIDDLGPEVAEEVRRLRGRAGPGSV